MSSHRSCDKSETLSSLTAPGFVVMTTTGAASDGKVGIMAMLGFHWRYCLNYLRTISLTHSLVTSGCMSQRHAWTLFMSMFTFELNRSFKCLIYWIMVVCSHRGHFDIWQTCHWHFQATYTVHIYMQSCSLLQVGVQRIDFCRSTVVFQYRGNTPKAINRHTHKYKHTCMLAWNISSIIMQIAVGFTGLRVI